jgi:hypothetical protein
MSGAMHLKVNGENVNGVLTHPLGTPSLGWVPVMVARALTFGKVSLAGLEIGTVLPRSLDRFFWALRGLRMAFR